MGFLAMKATAGVASSDEATTHLGGVDDVGALEEDEPVTWETQSLSWKFRRHGEPVNNPRRFGEPVSAHPNR